MFRCPLPSTGSAWGAFPCFAGTTRHSDSLTTFPPGFVAFTGAVPPPPVVRSQREAGAHLPLAWASHRCPPATCRGVVWASQVPGPPSCVRAPLFDPGETPGLGRVSAQRCCLPLAERRRLSRSIKSFEAPSRGPHTRCLRFAARLSPAPRKTRFRLGPSFAGRGLNPQGGSPKFQLLHRFLLGQASPGALCLSDRLAWLAPCLGTDSAPLS
jgi:hypothetical protein